ncbi:Tn3 family transposase [Methylomagnum sp.]
MPGLEGVRENPEDPLRPEACGRLGVPAGHRKAAEQGRGLELVARAIPLGHNQEFVQGEREDQEAAEGCRRLIKNAIVCWNCLYLPRLLAAETDPARRAELIEALRQGRSRPGSASTRTASSIPRRSGWPIPSD